MAPSSSKDARSTTNIVMIGKAGAGKSTLQCLVAGKSVFEPGTGDYRGGGHTTEIGRHEISEGIFLLDVPGLRDPVQTNDVKGKLKEALSQPGQYTILFVIKVEGLRLDPDSIAVVKQVLSALPDVLENMYGVIINRVDQTKYEQCSEDERGFYLRTCHKLLGDRPTWKLFVNYADPGMDKPSTDKRQYHEFFAEQLANSKVGIQPGLLGFIMGVKPLEMPNGCKEIMLSDDIIASQLQQIEHEKEAFQKLQESSKEESNKLAAEHAAELEKHKAESKQDVQVALIKAVSDVSGKGLQAFFQFSPWGAASSAITGATALVPHLVPGMLKRKKAEPDGDNDGKGDDEDK